MPGFDDPPRLLDDPGELEDLRLGLERLSKDLPSAAQLERLAAALGVAPVPEPAPKAAETSLAAKLGVTLGIAGIAAVGLVLATREPSPGEKEQRDVSAPAAPATSTVEEAVTPPAHAASPERARAATEDRTERAPAPERTEPRTETPVPATENTASAQPGLKPPVRDGDVERSAKAPAPNATASGRRPAGATQPAPSSPTNPPASSPASPTVATPPTEMELLRDARLVLESDASRALALTEQHRRVYPGGGFAQEREVIAITALVKLGRTAEARARAERFRESYPRSAYTERIERLVGP